MDSSDAMLAYFLLLGVLYVAYLILKYTDAQNARLKERNRMLAGWLQLAELQTGTPYYSAIAAEAFPGEFQRSFSQVLQNQVKNPASY